MPQNHRRELGSMDKEEWRVENETGEERIVLWRVVVNRPFSELLCGFMKDGIFVEGSSEDSAVGIGGLMLCSRRSVATIQSKVLLKYQKLKFCSFSFTSPHAPKTGWILISSKIKKGWWMLIIPNLEAQRLKLLRSG
ncbi:hypothetical protein Fmac_001927 [Flemingia macrophylla]|uniref:Uncharacterized protein n=1 Tax=Flemingia macrophylla TaxID=520843 RepID=A0ABD1NJT7_9FABA